MDQVGEAGRDFNEVLAQLDHDLRNPLTAILGFADLLATTELNDQQRGHLDRVQQAAENLVRIVDSIEERAAAAQPPA